MFLVLIPVTERVYPSERLLLPARARKTGRRARSTATQEFVGRTWSGTC